MSWWDDLLNGGTGVPNAAGDARSAYEPSVSGYRGDNGSLDANRIKAAMPAEMGDYVDMRKALMDEQQRSLDSYKTPELSGMQWLGHALSAASVPVAYAQGNTQFGNAMAGRTLPDIHNKRVADAQEEQGKARQLLTQQAYGDMGDYGGKYMIERQARIADARKKAAAIVEMGIDETTGQPTREGVEQAVRYLKAQGLHADAAEVAKMADPLPTRSPATPAPSPAAPSAPVSPNVPVAQAMPQGSFVPNQPDGATPNPEYAMNVGAGFKGNIPGGAPAAVTAPASAPLPATAPIAAKEDPGPYVQRPEIKAMFKKAQRVAQFDEEAGKQLFAQALIADRAAAEVWQKQQQALVGKQGSISNSTVIYGMDEDGNPVVMQPSSEGKLVRSELPSGVQALGPGGVSQQRKMGQGYADRYKEIQEGAVNAQDQIALLNLGSVALETGVYTGIGGEEVQALQKMGQLLGVDNAEKVGAGELVTSIQNRMSLLMRSGGNMPGALSDNDIKFLKASQFGLDKTPTGNRIMIEAFTKLAQRKLEIAKLADDYIAQHGQIDHGFNMTVRKYAEDNPLFATLPTGGAKGYQGLSDEELKKRLGG